MRNRLDPEEHAPAEEPSGLQGLQSGVGLHATTGSSPTILGFKHSG